MGEALTAPARPDPDERRRDEEWLWAIQHGDRAAFDRLVRAHCADLIAFAERIVGSRPIAEEVVMDVFISIWRRSQAWRPHGAFRVYLFGATRRRSYDYLRRRRKTVPLDERLVTRVEGGPWEDIRMDELQRALWGAINAFPPRRREVFVLSRFHGLRYTEIAAILGISVKTVEKHMGLALRQLRKRLGPFLSLLSSLGLLT